MHHPLQEEIRNSKRRSLIALICILEKKYGVYFSLKKTEELILNGYYGSSSLLMKRMNLDGANTSSVRISQSMWPHFKAEKSNSNLIERDEFLRKVEKKTYESRSRFPPTNSS